MNECEKMVARLERHWFAIGQALPELKAASVDLTGPDLVAKIDEIGAKYNLFG